MQPFGILDFLKVFLPKNSPENESVLSPTDTESFSNQKEDTISSATPTPVQAPPQPNHTAYQAFLDRHEQTAKKLRKK